MIGIGPYYTGTTGFAFGYYLDRNNILLLQAFRGIDDSDTWMIVWVMILLRNLLEFTGRIFQEILFILISD